MNKHNHLEKHTCQRVHARHTPVHVTRDRQKFNSKEGEHSFALPICKLLGPTLDTESESLGIGSRNLHFQQAAQVMLVHKEVPQLSRSRNL